MFEQNAECAMNYFSVSSIVAFIVSIVFIAVAEISKVLFFMFVAESFMGASLAYICVMLVVLFSAGIHDQFFN